MRPKKMLEAFSDVCDVITLCGNQMDPSRSSRIVEVLAVLAKEKPDLCYIESPTYPVMRHKDRKLIAQIHKMGIPTGYFYRVFCRRFPDKGRKRGFSRFVKDKGLDFLQLMTDRVLRNCDIIYLPSRQCMELFTYQDMRPLPPAGEDRLPARAKDPNHTCIYVGGIYGSYDGLLLLDAFGELYKRDADYRLILVCRKEEWERFEHPFKNEVWLEVHHTSEDGLVELYDRASLALIVQNANNSYNKYTVQVKTFEYNSFGLPIVAVRTEALSEYIEREKIGIIVDPSPESVACGITKIMNSKEKYKELRDNVRNALLERNLWNNRVETVMKDLLTK